MNASKIFKVIADYIKTHGAGGDTITIARAGRKLRVFLETNDYGFVIPVHNLYILHKIFTHDFIGKVNKVVFPCGKFYLVDSDEVV